jgi:ketosteroid isomerase-like protein
MSHENVDVVKRGIRAFNDRNIDLLAMLATSDFELFPAMMGVLEGASFRGREGIERYFEVLDDSFEYFRMTGEEFRDLGDSVIYVVQVEARGKGSGVSVTAEQTAIYDFRDGKASRGRMFLDYGEALKAVGLEE